MKIDPRYKGILYMLLASSGFAAMGGFSKVLKGSFNAGQLVFYRNAIGLLVLIIGFSLKPPLKKVPDFISCCSAVSWAPSHCIPCCTVSFIFLWERP
jgi:hypothetical protein